MKVSIYYAWLFCLLYKKIQSHCSSFIRETAIWLEACVQNFQEHKYPFSQIRSHLVELFFYEYLIGNLLLNPL